MHKKINIKIIVLISIFTLTCIFIYWPKTPPKTIKNVKLNKYFDTIDGYTTLKKIPLEDNAFQMLKLDDYAYYDYEGPKGRVNLYIGYYYTATKAYASHSPLICYPSQGWRIDSRPSISSLKIGKYNVNYEEVITSYGKNKELVLYWLQSYTSTNTQVYKNKIDMGINKFKNNDEQHGFVRVSTSINADYDSAKKRLLEFIETFYPEFISFINND